MTLFYSIGVGSSIRYMQWSAKPDDFYEARQTNLKVLRGYCVLAIF